MFEDFEFNPQAAALALLGAIISLIVMSKVDVGLVWRIGAFLLTAVVSYFVVNFISNK